MLWRQLTHGLRALLVRHRADRDIDDEAQHFFEELVAELESKGHAPEEARRLARLEIGSPLAVRERVRDSGWEIALAGLLDDCRRAVRRLIRTPGFTATAVLTLGLGLGAAGAIFSVVDAVLLRPLPYPEPDRLVVLRHTAPGMNLKAMRMAPSLYFTFREEGRVFEDVALWNGRRATVTGLERPEQAPVLFVTHSFLQTLRVEPALGRGFHVEDDEPRSTAKVLLANAYWRDRLGADPGVLGRTLVIEGTPHEVVGVLPESFEFLDEPVSLVVLKRYRREEVRLIDFGDEGIGRLKPGVTLAEGHADVARCIALAPSKFPLNAGFHANAFQEARITPALRLMKDHLVGDVREVLWVLMGAVAILLLIACANVANLLLVRADGRRQELAVRAALGAGRWRMGRELLLESMALSLGAGVVGLLACAAALPAIARASFVPLPRVAGVSMSVSTVVFIALAAAAAGGLFGVIALWRQARPLSADSLRSGGRSVTQGMHHRRAQRAIVAVQVALAMVLLAGSGLMIRTFQVLRDVDPGFTRPEHVQVVRISILASQVQEPAAVARMQESILRRFADIVGVEAVALSTSAPMDGGSENPVLVEGQELAAGSLPPVRRMKDVSPGWVAALGSRFAAGRDFTWHELHSLVPVVLVSENLARELWGAPQAAVGKRIRMQPGHDWSQVVGVVADLRDAGLMRAAPPMVYWPIMRRGKGSARAAGVARHVDVLVRSSRAGSVQFVQDLERELQELNGNIPLANVRTLREIYGRSFARIPLALLLLGVSATLALVLGMVGVYGVVAYSVVQRRRETGIRIALGSPLGSVTGLFMREGVGALALGIGAGLLGSLAATRWMESLLVGVGAADSLAYGASLLGLAGALLLATWSSARRAARVDPAETLRSE